MQANQRNTKLHKEPVYVERCAVKYPSNVASDVFEVIKIYLSDKFRFFGVCLGKA
jgi:hypothetical protein